MTRTSFLNDLYTQLFKSSGDLFQDIDIYFSVHHLSDLKALHKNINNEIIGYALPKSKTTRNIRSLNVLMMISYLGSHRCREHFLCIKDKKILS
ncbi:Uncharacterised protein [Chlamydia abortus]|nr:Uncharacterised protein [Chlamydia abortus]